MYFKIDDNFKKLISEFINLTEEFEVLNSISNNEYDEINKLARTIVLKCKHEYAVLYRYSKDLQNRLCLGGFWKYDHITLTEIIRFFTKEI